VVSPFVGIDLGKLWTTAKWMRSFIRGHPEYKFDSAVTKEINYDLVRAVEKITKGLERDEGLGVEMLGRYGIESGNSTPQSGRNQMANGINGD
jgi:hypothetical protein